MLWTARSNDNRRDTSSWSLQGLNINGALQGNKTGKFDCGEEKLVTQVNLELGTSNTYSQVQGQGRKVGSRFTDSHA